MGQEKYANTIDEKGRWNGKISRDEKALGEPFRNKKPSVYFVNSMSDLFHENIPDEWIYEIFQIMSLADRHTFQVLTKRPERMMAMLKGKAIVPNVWLGVSVENQQTANDRIPKLLNTPAAVRFLSCEPLLGPVDLFDTSEGILDGIAVIKSGGVTKSTPDNPPEGYDDSYSGIDWVIAGGESGPGARPMHPDWVKSLRDQCNHASAPFFFKQWGVWAPYNYFNTPGPLHLKDFVIPMPDGTIVEKYPCWYNETKIALFKVGKKYAGRHLDGRTWDEYPTQMKAIRGSHDAQHHDESETPNPSIYSSNV